MRSLLLIAVLATACDQGAKAAPPRDEGPIVINAQPRNINAPPPHYVAFTVNSSADFLEKATVLLEELFQIFELANQDCEALATKIEQWSDANVTRFSVLLAYSKAHPEITKELEERFKPHTERLMNVMTPALTKCMQGETLQRMTKAFQKLEQSTQIQRPR